MRTEVVYDAGLGLTPTRRQSARRAGTIGIVGGFLWVVAIAIEYSQDLQPPSDGALFLANQSMFVVALGCWATAVMGLRRVAAAGHGFGRHSLTAWAVGYVLVGAGALIPTVLDLFMSVSPSAYEDNPLSPIGGVLAILASFAAGVAIVGARRLTGWSRWGVLGFAIYVFGFLFVPLLFGVEVNAITETIWGLWWVVIGAALIGAGRNESASAVTPIGPPSNESRRFQSFG